VAIATLGIPLPVPVLKDLAEAFPCMNCGCGCVNAAACWRQCCCYTNAEKLAWANRHGVEVPQFVLQQAAAESDLPPGEWANARPCCRQRLLAAKLGHGCNRRSASSDEQPEAEPPIIPGVLAIHALKCQGLSVSVASLPPTIPTDEIGAELALLPGEQVIAAEILAYEPPFFDAVVPPPESAVL
jgi:hypothetical protein